MIHKCVAGSIFFKTTITADVYHDIIYYFIAPLHKNEHDALFLQGNAWWQVAKDMITFFGRIFWGVSLQVAAI